MNFEDALKKLDICEKLEKVYKILDDPNHKKTEFNDDWNDDYSALDDIQPEVYEAFKSKGKVIPEIGDIAILKIKLTDLSKADTKKIYEGCERRPVVVIRAHSNSVDAVEISHSEYFQGYKLIPIGKLNGDDEYSYVNIYTVEKYTNLPVSYKFPKAFNKDNTPMTKAEYCKIKIGTIYSGPDADEPYIVDFNYRDNYKFQLDDELLDRILGALISYYEGEDK